MFIRYIAGSSAKVKLYILFTALGMIAITFFGSFAFFVVKPRTVVQFKRLVTKEVYWIQHAVAPAVARGDHKQISYTLSGLNQLKLVKRVAVFDAKGKAIAFWPAPFEVSVPQNVAGIQVSMAPALYTAKANIKRDKKTVGVLYFELSQSFVAEKDQQMYVALSAFVLMIFVMVSGATLFLDRIAAGLLRQIINASSQVTQGHYQDALDMFEGNLLLVPADVIIKDESFLLQQNFITMIKSLIEMRRTLDIQLEENIEAFNLADGANRAKSEFLARMSHELRTPLNAIIGYAELVQEELEDINAAEAVDDLQKIVVAGKHLLGLINDILDLSKIEAGKISLNIKSFEVGEMVRGVVQSIEPLAKQQKNVISVHVDEDVVAVQDEQKLKQCLINLLGNAVKFTYEGSIALHVRQVERDDLWVCFEVVDTGRGIAPEKLGTLFDAFSQAHESETRSMEGTGLGLAITSKFAVVLGGELFVSSTLNEGSSFKICIPIRHPEQRFETRKLKILSNPSV